MKSLNHALLLTLVISFTAIIPCSVHSQEVYSGKSIGPVHLGMTLSEAFRLLNNPRVKELKESGEKDFFLQVFRISMKGLIKYDSLYYLHENKLVLVVLEKRVAAIALLAGTGKFEGVVGVIRGVEPAIVFYGSSGLQVKKVGDHRAYIYKKRGIMIFDDDSNGTIDMLIVYK